MRALQFSQPQKLAGMNWLPEPDPHVRVLDILESDGREQRWLSGLIPREATLEHLRSSLLDVFPFGAREAKHEESTEKLWDRRSVKCAFDASVSAGVSANLPLVRSVGSLSLGTQGGSTRSVVFEFTDVTSTVARRLVLLDEHLGKRQPTGVSGEFQTALTAGRIYVVVELCRAGQIRVDDSSEAQVSFEISQASTAAAASVRADGGLSKSATLLFERGADGAPAAFCVKVKQVGFDSASGQFFLGRVRRAKVRAEAATIEGSDLDEDVLSLK